MTTVTQVTSITVSIRWTFQKYYRKQVKLLIPIFMVNQQKRNLRDFSREDLADDAKQHGLGAADDGLEQTREDQVLQ